jgi:hypothetical protein
MKTKHSAILMASMLLMLAVPLAHGQAFSVTAGGPTPAPGDDILNPGITAPVPALIGSSGSPVLEVDAFSWGHHSDFSITDYQFSVDPVSVGAPASAVAAEVAGAAGGPGDHPADIYNSTGAGGNTLLWDGNGVANPGIAPSLTLAEPGGDNVDGWDNRSVPAPTIFYSLDVATAGAGGGVGADVFLAPSITGYDVPPTPALFAGAAALGLDIVGGAGSDDIDALAVFDHSGLPGVFDGVDYILFSLTPGSASLVSGTPYSGFGAGDLFFADATGGKGLHISAVALGLAPTDNLDALDVIPEPSAVLLLALGGTGIYIRRRLDRVRWKRWTR